MQTDLTNPKGFLEQLGVPLEQYAGWDITDASLSLSRDRAPCVNFLAMRNGGRHRAGKAYEYLNGIWVDLQRQRGGFDRDQISEAARRGYGHGNLNADVPTDSPSIRPPST